MLSLVCCHHALFFRLFPKQQEEQGRALCEGAFVSSCVEHIYCHMHRIMHRACGVVCMCFVMLREIIVLCKAKKAGDAEGPVNKMESFYPRPLFQVSGNSVEAMSATQGIAHFLHIRLLKYRLLTRMIYCCYLSSFKSQLS